MKNLKQDKKAGIGIVIFFSVLLIILVFGFIAVIAVSVVDLASDEITPIMTSIGVLDKTSTNISEYAEYGFGTANTIVQALPWVIAFGYMMALIFTIVFIFVTGYSPHPAFFALYISLMILLIFGCVIISNMYQDIYTGTDELATRLQEQTIMSYLILQAPWVLGIKIGRAHV